jgi:uncharacterized membrane protein (UPF0127 family)
VREQIDGAAAGDRPSQAGGGALSDAHDLRHVPVARSIVRRMVGLIGARNLFLFIPRCRAVHTFFMRSPIDVVFLDHRGVVLAVTSRARPWRVLIGPRAAASVLELPPGHAAHISLAVGDAMLLDC